jgi:tetratricopeptide (TPR) repeat protein
VNRWLRRVSASLGVVLLLLGNPGASVQGQVHLPAGETPDDYVADARDAIEKENYQYAVQRLTEGVRRFPEAVDIRVELAELYYDKELFDLALEHYKVAEELSPNSYSILYDTAFTLGRLNREAEAITYLKRIENIYPGSPELASDLGWLYFKTRQLDAGEDVLLEALSAYGEDRSVAMTLGTIYAAMYRYGESKRYYREAIDAALQNGLGYFASVAYYNLSLLEKSFYRFDNALESTNRSLLHARRATGFLARGELYEMQMDLASAHKEYERAFTLDEETPLPAINLSALYQRSGHLDRALSHARRVYDDEDLSWMFNFGIDEVRHSKDLNEILADTHLGLARETWRTPAAGILPRLRRLGSYLRHRALAWYHRHRYVQLADKTAGTYLDRSNYLDAYWTYYLAAQSSPRVAEKYLSLARQLELEVIPESAGSYDLEEALLKRDPRRISRALETLDPVWESARIESALKGLLGEAKPGSPEYNRAAVRLYEINPGAFRQNGFFVPARVSTAGLAPRQRRLLLRHLRRAGFYPSDEPSAVTLEVSRQGEAVRVRSFGSLNGPETVDAEGLASADLAELAAAVADRLLRYPLTFSEVPGPEAAEPRGREPEAATSG